MQKVVTLQLIGSSPITTFWIYQKRYALLVVENLRNLRLYARIGIIALTHSVSGCCHICIHRFSQDLRLRRGIVGSRFCSLMFGEEPFPNLNIEEQFVMSYLIKSGNLTYSEFVDSIGKINCATSITGIVYSNIQVINDKVVGIRDTIFLNSIY